MSIQKGNRAIAIISMIIGLIVAGTILYLHSGTNVTPPYLTEGQWKCASDLKEFGGWPIKAQKVSVIYGCEQATGYLDKESFSALVWTWQFFANWVVCSLPFFGISMLLVKRRARV